VKAAERRPSRSGSKAHDAGNTKDIAPTLFAPAHGVRLDPAQQADAQREPKDDTKDTDGAIATRRDAVPFALALNSTTRRTHKRGQRRRYSAVRKKGP
jgi:hypothetical protein